MLRPASPCIKKLDLHQSQSSDLAQILFLLLAQQTFELHKYRLPGTYWQLMQGISLRQLRLISLLQVWFQLFIVLISFHDLLQYTIGELEGAGLCALQGSTMDLPEK